MEPVEVADVAVQRADGDDGLRIQEAGGQHRSERVEVRVPVRRDDLLGAHRRIVARGRALGMRDCLDLDERAARQT